MDSQEYDVLIIGARVAGSTLAALLGDAGCRVLLVDSGSFPSPTLSTHFFRGAGLVLKRLNVLDKVLALGAPPLTCQYTYMGTDQPVVGPPQSPGEIGFALSVRREPLDYLLLQRARKASTVDFRSRTRVTQLLWEGKRVVGAQLMNESGERTVHAKVVAGADGRHSFVARSVNAQEEISDPPIRGIYYCYVRGFASPNGSVPDGPEFSVVEDEIAYVFPSDGGVTCIALSTNLDTFARIKQNYSEGFRERISHHQGIAERFASSVSLGKVLACGLEHNYVRVPTGPGWVLVGDAGMHQDPWSGMGMDMAGTHSTFLAEALIDYLAGKSTEQQALLTYHQRRNEHGLQSYRTTIGLGRDLRQLAQG